MNFIRAIGKAQRPRRSIDFSKRRVRAHAHRPECLHRAVCNAAQHCRDQRLDHRDLFARSLGPDGVNHPCGFEYQQTRLFNFEPRVCNPVTDIGAITQIASKGFSLVLFSNQVLQKVKEQD